MWSLELFQMVIDPEGPGFDIVMPMDVTIGTVPLSDAQQYYNSHTDNPTPTENTENTEESKARKYGYRLDVETFTWKPSS